MDRRVAALLACLLPAACADGSQPFVADTAQLPAGTFGGGFADADVRAVQQAQWAFADPGRTQGRPIEAIRAAASMDYIAGQLYTSPRWAHIGALTKEQLLQGRVEVRQALGVVPGTSSQAVVERLTSAGNALAAGDAAAAVAQLGAPVFQGSGQQVLARLSDMPYLRMANVSTMNAAGQLFDNSRRRAF